MITPSLVYWITRLDSVTRFLGHLECVLALLIVMSTITSVMYLCTRYPEVGDCEESRLAKRLIKRALPIIYSVGLVVTTIRVFVPTTKEMAAIVVLPAIANNESIQTIGSEFYQLAIDWLKELKPNKE